jgi:hypothetical protein
MFGMVIELRKMKAQNLTNDDHHNDMLRRSTILAVQLCILNGLSLLYATVLAFWLVLMQALHLANLMNAYHDVMLVYFLILEYPQYAALIGSTNLGFIIHYRYSLMYRDAAREICTQMRKWFQSCFNRLKKLVAKKKVAPANQGIEMK